MAGRRGATVAVQRKVGQRERLGPDTLADLPLLRNSERSTLKRCEFLWDLTYNKLLKPQTEAPALRYGSMVHAALAAYYIPGVKRGEHPATAFERLYEIDMKRNREIFGMKVDEDEKWVNAAELGPAMLNNYLDEWGDDKLWEVLVTEHPFQTVVCYPDDVYAEFSVDGKSHKKGDPWFKYVGILDGVWRNRSDKTIWIPDHKTTDGIGDKKWAHLTLDDQAGGYWSFGVDFLVMSELMKQNQKLHGMMYNLLRKALPDERASKYEKGRRLYLNLDGSVSKKQPPAYFMRKPVFRGEYDKQEARRRAMIDYNRIEMFRQGKLPISKSPGQFTCPYCSMRDACEVHEAGGDLSSFLKATTKQWDPYSEHEIYDGR